MATRKTKSLYEFPAPIDNEKMVGHNEILSDFVAAWQNRDVHPLHPVWMLTGPRGIGKATLAYKIAKMVYGNVGDCFIVDISANIDKDGKPWDGKQISVHTIRAMIEKMQMSSMSGEWRVVIIDSVDELSVSASNAMLKLLEEPPAKTLFLLVVHQLSNVLPTVRSRARVEKMRPLNMTQLRELCARFMPDTEISNEILKLSNGSFGQIANLVQSGGDEIYDELIDLIENKNATAGDIMSMANKIGAEPALYPIILNAVARYNLAELYPMATNAIADITRIYLEPTTAIFKIIQEIKKCL